MTLEEQIRATAKRGELTYLSVIFSAGKWRAVYTPASSFANVHAESSDPVEALIAALKGGKKTRVRQEPKDHEEPDFG